VSDPAAQSTTHQSTTQRTRAQHTRAQHTTLLLARAQHTKNTGNQYCSCVGSSMRANSRRNQERVQMFGDSPITSSTWVHVEEDAPIHPRRLRIITARLLLLSVVVSLGFLASYLPFTNFVIASGFVLCTVTLCGLATLLLLREQRAEDNRQSSYSSVPTDDAMNDLMSAAAMLATARNISTSTQRNSEKSISFQHVA
jgi:hypothetical protein